MLCYVLRPAPIYGTGRRFSGINLKRGLHAVQLTEKLAIDGEVPIDFPSCGHMVFKGTSEV